MTADELKRQWERLCLKYSPATALIAGLWEELVQAYTSEERYYHTLEHLAYMLELAEKYKQDGIQYDLLLFAVFYHDFVYSPTRSDNEARSAEVAEDRLQKLALSAPDIALVKQMITATKTHQQQQNDTANFLLDLDLAILGAGWQKYNVYRQAVRKEYSMYPDNVYRPGRRNVLLHFLALPYIYKTPLFRQRLELQARENMRMELDMLS